MTRSREIQRWKDFFYREEIAHAPKRTFSSCCLRMSRSSATAFFILWNFASACENTIKIGYSCEYLVRLRRPASCWSFAPACKHSRRSKGACEYLVRLRRQCSLSEEVVLPNVHVQAQWAANANISIALATALFCIWRTCVLQYSRRSTIRDACEWLAHLRQSCWCLCVLLLPVYISAIRQIPRWSKLRRNAWHFVSQRKPLPRSRGKIIRKRLLPRRKCNILTLSCVFTIISLYESKRSIWWPR